MNAETESVSPSVSRWLRFSAWLGRMWRTLVAWFSPPAQEAEPSPVIPVSPAPPPPPPGKLTGRRRLGSPMVVPASGYIFTFRVHGTFVWGSDGLYQAELSSSIESLMPFATRRLKALAAQRARQHPAHHAEQLERELQQQLAEEAPWRFSWRGTSLTCRPYVWIELDEQVKLAVQPYWEQLIKIDCEHDVQTRRAEYAEKLSHQWATILADLLGSPVADGAAELTEKELADVVRKIVAERKAAADKLETLMTQKVTDGDAFERDDHFNALKERLERRADRMFEQPTTSVNGQRP
ncbi:hypothetical protein [Paractinoplanes maris]|uniref:hypothetical protein n=1 Tax=Paractinoplanes maris TaxID=1734446 RepID=UPI002021E9EA|nr:hypothetical protein [Actinoplanes maris]